MMFADWYEPGFKAGGPVRSCVNFARYMKSQFDIYIFTGDRDLGDKSPYKGISTDAWLDMDGLHIFYASPAMLSLSKMKQLINQVDPGYLYINSMFSKHFAIYPLLLKWRNSIKAKIILAPRGMLKESALQFKSRKKNIFLTAINMSGLAKQIAFHVTNEAEREEVHSAFGKYAVTHIASNFPATVPSTNIPTLKKPGALNILFVGRIHPIKNLDFLIASLQKVSAQVKLTIVGSKEDVTYWEACSRLIAALPSNVTVDYLGEMPHHQLPAIFAAQHVLALPTRGENFGHAIFDGLAAGKPVIISDQTQWRNLNSVMAGCDLPLSKPELFTEAVNKMAAMDQEQYNDWSMGAWQLSKEYTQRLDLESTYKKIFA
jgi:glycosyltransferase involved in cell wall biosynthesis